MQVNVKVYPKVDRFSNKDGTKDFRKQGCLLISSDEEAPVPYSVFLDEGQQPYAPGLYVADVLLRTGKYGLDIRLENFQPVKA